VLGLSGPVSSRRIHASNTERGGTFQLLCRDALNKALSRNFDLEVRIGSVTASPTILIWQLGSAILLLNAKRSHLL
jgi:hypothetical protein